MFHSSDHQPDQEVQQKGLCRSVLQRSPHTMQAPARGNATSTRCSVSRVNGAVKVQAVFRWAHTRLDCGTPLLLLLAAQQADLALFSGRLITRPNVGTPQPACQRPGGLTATVADGTAVTASTSQDAAGGLGPGALRAEHPQGMFGCARSAAGSLHAPVADTLDVRPAAVVATAERKGLTFHGVHHVALICSNLERSMEFYQGVLGECHTPTAKGHISSSGTACHSRHLPGPLLLRPPASSCRVPPPKGQHLTQCT